MSTMKDYTAEEWKAITAAPAAAGLLITMADASGLAGIAKEAVAIGKTITDAAAGDTPEIVKALAEGVKSAGRPGLPDIPMGDKTQTQEALVGTIRAAVRAIEAKSPAEALPYKTWLASVATKVAHASKEGGFLGFGGKVVSEDEEAALRQLSEVLGVTTRTASS